MYGESYRSSCREKTHCLVSITTLVGRYKILPGKNIVGRTKWEKKHYLVVIKHNLVVTKHYLVVIKPW